MNDVPRRRQARLLVLAVILLGLPSVAFVVAHGVLGWLEVQPSEPYGLVLAWTLALTGVFGAFTTVGAILLASVASVRGQVSATAMILMWSSVAVSLLALVYLAEVRP